jgi:hypothetical protein
MTRIVKKIILPSFFLLPFYGKSQSTFSSFLGIDNTWSNVLNWSGGIPALGVDAIINDDCNVTINSNCNNVFVNPNFQLTINNGVTFVIGGNLDIGLNSLLDNNGTIELSGNYLIDGITKITVGGTLELVGKIELDN